MSPVILTPSLGNSNSTEILAFTGHRPNKLGGYEPENRVKLKVKAFLRQIIKTIKPGGCISGMALGVDQWAAEVCNEYGLKWVAALPCFEYDSMWPKAAQIHGQELLDTAHRVVYVSKERYKPALMQVRNVWMVDRCSKLVAIWDGTDGGTANCINYAKQRLVKNSILRINPLNWTVDLY